MEKQSLTGDEEAMGYNKLTSEFWRREEMERTLDRLKGRELQAVLKVKSFIALFWWTLVQHLFKIGFGILPSEWRKSVIVPIPQRVRGLFTEHRISIGHFWPVVINATFVVF